MTPELYCEQEAREQQFNKICFRHHFRCETDGQIREIEAMQHSDGGNRLAGLLLPVFIVLIFIFTISSFEPGWLVSEQNRVLIKYASSRFRNGTRKHRSTTFVDVDNDFKIILLWNSFFGDSSFGFRNLQSVFGKDLICFNFEKII